MKFTCQICKRTFENTGPTVLVAEIGSGNSKLRLSFLVDMCPTCKAAIRRDYGLLPAAIVKGLQECTPHLWREEAQDEEN